MSDNSDSDRDYYHYDPALEAAAIFVAAYGITMLIHSVQLAQKRTWYFIPFFIGGLFMFAGYLSRVLSIQQAPDYDQGPYIAQTLLILLAPALYAASIYMILGRIMILVQAESYALFKRKWLTTVFVSGDVISFVVQGAGGGIMASSDDQEGNDLGQTVIVFGLFVQIVVFGLFIIVTALFHWRITRQPTARSQIITAPWLRYIYVLYVASLLVMVRSIFRAAEFIGGRDSELMTNEIYLYLFDTLLMFIVSVIFNFYHPSTIITKRSKEMMNLDEISYLSVRGEAV